MTYSKSEVAGMVTLYNSSLDVIKNIATYNNQVDKVYVIDNSESPDSVLISLLRNFQNLCYLPNNDNLGIGFALNRAAQQAIQDGYSFLLTMDDDSKSPTDLVEKMLTFLATQNLQTIGIVSSNHSTRQILASFTPVMYTMTSGNLLNLEAYKLVGPFNDDLFIDHVDHEYGIRLNAKQFRVIELDNVYLDHKLGVEKEITLFHKAYKFVSHSPLRMYYIVRNGVYVARQYPVFGLTAIKLISKELVKSIFFESMKCLRLKYILRGLSDGLLGHLGRVDKITKQKNNKEYAS